MSHSVKCRFEQYKVLVAHIFFGFFFQSAGLGRQVPALPSDMPVLELQWLFPAEKVQRKKKTMNTFLGKALRAVLSVILKHPQ